MLLQEEKQTYYFAVEKSVYNSKPYPASGFRNFQTMSGCILIVKLSRISHELKAGNGEFCEKALYHTLNCEVSDS
jgi:hypothetical protein